MSEDEQQWENDGGRPMDVMQKARLARGGRGALAEDTPPGPFSAVTKQLDADAKIAVLAKAPRDQALSRTVTE